MAKKQIRSALADSLKAEERSVQSRFEKADTALNIQESKETQESFKEEKPKNSKIIRDSFTIPEFDYLKIQSLQERLLKLGCNANKSEIVRAGFHALEKLSDDDLLSILEDLEKIKTGRPKKK